MSYAGHSVIHGDGNILAAGPLAAAGLVNVHIGNREFATLSIHHVAAHQDHQPFGCSCGSAHNADAAGDGPAFMPFRVSEIHDVDLVGDVVTGFSGTDSHEGKYLQAIFDTGDGIA